MLKDGIYELFYRAASSPQGSYGSMLLSLRRGLIMAADPWGGVCQGTCTFNQRDRSYRVAVEFHIPPGGMLVTDDIPRENGDLITFSADIADPIGDASTLVEIAGQPVSIALHYKGPMPV